MTKEETAGCTIDERSHIPGNPNPRNLQFEGWFRTRHTFWNSNVSAILQIPGGCGKNGLITLLPFEIA